MLIHTFKWQNDHASKLIEYLIAGVGLNFFQVFPNAWLPPWSNVRWLEMIFIRFFFSYWDNFVFKVSIWNHIFHRNSVSQILDQATTEARRQLVCEKSSSFYAAA